jgi:membrane-associated phospholipid phosphatase
MQEMTTARSRDAWKTYAFWAIWVGVAFFSVYPTSNWLTALRGEHFSLYFAAELNVPFVPEFIVVYLSMYVLFMTPPFFLQVAELAALGKQLIVGTLLSGLIFMLLPAKLGFERQIPKDEWLASFYSTLFAIDMPHNMVPSLHVVFSALIVFSLAESETGGRFRLSWYGWLAVICASTLLVHQHHLIDIVAALVLVYLVRKNIVKSQSHE